jgi:hypothetical protein
MQVFQAEREKKRAERMAATPAPAAAAQDDKVHPSWAAKNKEKAAIAAALAGTGPPLSFHSLLSPRNEMRIEVGTRSMDENRERDC